LGADHLVVNTNPRPSSSRLAALLAFPLVALVAGCGTGAAPEPPSGRAAIVTDVDPVVPSADPLPALEGSGDPAPTSPASGSGSTEPEAFVEDAVSTADLAQVDADLAELDTRLSEADRDLATPEGDF
jgi:hypothetical protein